MVLTPENWSVVVVGQWNPAILTPSGIGRRLFDVDTSTPLEVLVPLDHYGPYHVKHNNVVVVAGNDRLIVSPGTPTFAKLKEAMDVAGRAIDSLPETPFKAAGVNIQFRAKEPIAQLVEITDHDADMRLSDMRLPIVGRSHRRTVEWSGGKINISVEQQPENDYTVQLNFELKADGKDELRAWVQIPIAKIQSATDDILKQYLKLDEENLPDDTAE